MTPAAAILLSVFVLAVTAIVGLVCYRIGYTVRDREAIEDARRQARQRQEVRAEQYAPAHEPAAAKPTPTPPMRDDQVSWIAERITAAMVGSYTPPIGHEDLADDIVSRLRALPLPIGHREIVEAIVLEKPGRHSPAWVAGEATQRALTAGTGEYRVLAVEEPDLLCLDGLVEPVADAQQWAAPEVLLEPVIELERVG